MIIAAEVLVDGVAAGPGRCHADEADRLHSVGRDEIDVVAVERVSEAFGLVGQVPAELVRVDLVPQPVDPLAVARRSQAYFQHDHAHRTSWPPSITGSGV
jgi:hypothetical protein